MQNLPGGKNPVGPVPIIPEVVILNLDGLTKREIDVADSIYKGLSNREIGKKLFITEKTVKYHLTNIYKKHKLKSRAQLILKMIEIRENL